MQGSWYLALTSRNQSFSIGSTLPDPLVCKTPIADGRPERPNHVWSLRLRRGPNPQRPQVPYAWRQTTTRSDRTRAWATVRQHPPLRRGRLCHPDPLRRPHQPSPASPPCIRFEPGHLMGAGHLRHFDGTMNRPCHIPHIKTSTRRLKTVAYSPIIDQVSCLTPQAMSVSPVPSRTIGS